MRNMTRKLAVIAMVVLSSSCDRRGESVRPPVLTRAHLEAEDVAYEAWKVLLDHMDSQKGGDYASLARRLPRHWRAVYTTFWLECEVNNGGHHQFFWNSGGKLNAETLADLKYIGAERFAEIFGSALEVYGKQDYREEKKSSGNKWEAFSQGYREELYEEFDERFFEAAEKQRVSSVLSQYILKNRDLYLRDAGEQ